MYPNSEIQVRFSFGRRAALLMLLAAAGLLVLAGGLLPAGQSTASAAAGAGADAVDLVVTLVPPEAGAEPCAPGSRLIRVDAAGGRTALSEGLETACDPAVDPTGGRLVFRGRETAGAPWRIWQLDLAVAGGLRPLTPPETSCVRPFVLADGGVGFLCDGDVVRTAPSSPGGSEVKPQAPSLIRLTSSGGAIEAATVLPDGRFLLTTTDAAGDPVLLTSQPDGTWATRWRDDPVPGLLGVRPLPPDGLLLAVREDGATPGAGGGRLWLGSLTDPFAALRPVGPARSGKSAVTLRDPWPLPGGDVLAAVRPAPGEPFRIERLVPGGGEARVLATFDGDALQPVALAPRSPDTQIPSIVKPELNTGYLVLFDAARSDVPGLAGGLDRSAIAAVRVFPWADGPRADSAVDLEPADDGSLYLEVPADRPLGIALVGAAGDLLAPAGGPLWVRPNERRACMGCHVSRRYAPPNVRPMALLEPPQWVGWGAERVSPRSEFEEGSH